MFIILVMISIVNDVLSFMKMLMNMCGSVVGIVMCSMRKCVFVLSVCVML